MGRVASVVTTGDDVVGAGDVVVAAGPEVVDGMVVVTEGFVDGKGADVGWITLQELTVSTITIRLKNRDLFNNADWVFLFFTFITPIEVPWHKEQSMQVISVYRD